MRQVITTIQTMMICGTGACVVKPVLADLSLDHEVAVKVMGLEVIGVTECGTDPETTGYVHVGWGIGTLKMRPVYVRSCKCDDMDKHIEEEMTSGVSWREREARITLDQKTMGHYRICLAVVPPYSSSPTDCAKVKKKLRDAGVEFEVRFRDGTDDEDNIVKGVEVASMQSPWLPTWADTEEEAVCRFAIRCAEAGLLE